MEELTKFTPTELLKRGNDIKAKHDYVKDSIVADINEVEKLQNQINDNVSKLEVLEQDYIKIIELINELNVI